MSETNRSKLAIFDIILTVIGIVVLTIYYEIGLTIVFLSILLLAGYFVRQRLLALGAESFALGAIFTWLGFFTVSFPVLAFAWSILTFNQQLIFFVIGIFLILFGFSFEAFDLNVRFLKIIRTLQANLSDAWITVRKTLFRSIWSLLAVLLMVLAILTYFFNTIEELFPNIFGFNYGVSLELLLLGVIFLIIELRHPVMLIVKSALSSVKLLGIALFTRLRRLPSLLRDFGRLLRRWFSGIFTILTNLTRYLTSNLFVTGILATIIFGYYGFQHDDIILKVAALIFLLIALINVLTTRQGAIANRVASIQQSAYRRSFTLRHLVRSRYTGDCPSCHSPVVPGRKYCQNCGIYIPDCLVCRHSIFAGEEVLTCHNCEYVGHADHLERWLSIRPTCPNCREPWQ